MATSPCVAPAPSPVVASAEGAPSPDDADATAAFNDLVTYVAAEPALFAQHVVRAHLELVAIEERVEGLESAMGELLRAMSREAEEEVLRRQLGHVVRKRGSA